MSLAHKTSFKDLPTEVVQMIVEYLDQKEDQLAVSVTTRWLHNAVKHVLYSCPLVSTSDLLEHTDTADKRQLYY